MGDCKYGNSCVICSCRLYAPPVANALDFLDRFAYLLCGALRTGFVLFQFVLSDFSRFSPLLWTPVMILETFVLLIAVAKIENKFGLDRKDKPIRLSF